MWAWPSSRFLWAGSALTFDGQVSAPLTLSATRRSFCSAAMTPLPAPAPMLHAIDTCISEHACVCVCGGGWLHVCVCVCVSKCK